MRIKDRIEETTDNIPTPGDLLGYGAHAKEKKKKKAAPLGKRRAFPRRKGYVVALLLLGLVTAAFLLMLIIADILPPDLTLILTAAVILLLLFTNFMFSSRYKWKRITGIVLAAVLILLLSVVTSYMKTTVDTLNNMNAAATSATGPPANSVDVSQEPFSIYLTGIDQWESEKGMDLERSDVNMIVTVNPRTKKVLLTSIPRDSYVKLHTAQQMDKLTHTGIYGVDETVYTVQDWLGVDLNYFVKMNFSAARDIIDAMGGIRVYSPVAFDSSLRDYHYEKGWNLMGGKRALFFARERHAFEDEDAARVENQQRVMQAMIDRMTSSTTLLMHYGDILEAAGDNLSTNMSSNDMTELVKMQITDLAKWDVKTQKITGDYDMDYVASLTQSQKFSIYRTDTDSVRKCITGINAVLNPTASEIEEADRTSSRSFVVNVIRHIGESIGGSDEKDGEEEK